MEVFNLNIRPGKACPVLHCSQFDKGREFRANLFDGAEVFTLTGSETLSVIEKKADGNMVTIGVANTSDNYVVFGTTEQMTALAGCQLCELRIVDGEDLIGSLNFLLDCEESPDTGIESESAIHNLQEQIGEAVAEQYSGEDVIFDPTPTAGHGVGFAVTSEGVKDAIPTELNDFDDVEIDDPEENQALVWDPTTQTWRNGEVSTVGSIDDLDDVDTTDKAEGDSLRYNATDGKWEAKPTTVEMTLAEYEALGGDFSGYENTIIIITDAPNLNETAKQISYDGGTDTVWDKVEDKQKKLAYTPIIDEAFTSSTSFAYTGKSVTCPVGHIYIVRARVSYSNGAPQEIGASNSSTNADVYRCYARTDKACEVVFILTGGETAYIWAKYASASSNSVRITAVDITI